MKWVFSSLKNVCKLNIRYLFLLITIGGMYICEVSGIELNMITENVIKGKPVRLYCHIPNFTNTAALDMPNGLPIRKVFCNNRDGCTINRHKIFNVNSNFSGLTLMLKNITETVEGNYICIYKGQITSYSLNISSLNIIDPNNGCNITKKDMKFGCQTKCLMLRNNQTIQWEFKKENNETRYWNTSTINEVCNCCNEKKDKFVSQSSIGNQNGMLSCSITLEEGFTIRSPELKVTFVDDGLTERNQYIFSCFGSIILVILVVTIFFYKKSRRPKKQDTTLVEINEFIPARAK